jgi:hypothetical protein
MTADTPDFDYIDLEELLDVIDSLLAFTQAGTFDEDPGKYENWERALRVFRRYRPAT